MSAQIFTCSAHSLNPFPISIYQVVILVTFFTYLAIFGSILPGKVVQGVVLHDGTRLHYRCKGQFLFLAV